MRQDHAVPRGRIQPSAPERRCCRRAGCRGPAIATVAATIHIQNEREEEPKPMSRPSGPSRHDACRDRDAERPASGASRGPAASPCFQRPPARRPSGTAAAPSAGRTRNRSTAGRPRSCPGRGRREQRVQRAEQHAAIGDHQQHVVEQQQRLARDSANAAPRRPRPRAPRVTTRERAADHDDQEGEG